MEVGLIKSALAIQGKTGLPLGDILVERKFLGENDFLSCVAGRLKLNFVTSRKLAAARLSQDLLTLLPVEVAERLNILPVRYDAPRGVLFVLMSNPGDRKAMHEITVSSGVVKIKPILALASVIRRGIAKHYRGRDDAFGPALEESGPGATVSDARTGASRAGSDMPEEGDEAVDFGSLTDDSYLDEANFTKNAERVAAWSGELPGSLDEEDEELVARVYEDAEDIEPAEVLEEIMEGEEIDDKKALDRPLAPKGILVVESHEKIRDFIIRLMRREGNEHVMGTADLEEAEKIVSRHLTRLVVVKERDLAGSDIESRFVAIDHSVRFNVIRDYTSALCGESHEYSKLASSFLDNMEVLMNLLDREGGYHPGHSNTVARHAKLLALKLGVAPNTINEIQLSGYLHDLGKKKGGQHIALIDIEGIKNREHIEDDLEIPLKLISQVRHQIDCDRILRRLYERVDGKGYPDGYEGRQIPLGARILSMVDSFESLTMPSPAGRGISRTEAIEELQAHAGTLFDQELVDAFIQVLRENTFLDQMDAGRETLLLVDGEAKFTTLLELKFAGEGHLVKVARNVAEALKMFESYRPDLIISEVDLDDVSGIDFIKALQEQDGFGDIPFIFVSENDDSRIVNRALSLGAEDYITKPVKVDVLSAKVSNILARLKAKRSGPSKSSDGVAGSLREMSIPDIVQILGAGHKTGAVSLTVSGLEAVIHIEEGRIVNAEIGDLSGEEAFYEIVKCTDGEFRISSDVEITKRLINKTNDSLLLEGFRRLDEAERDEEPDITVDDSDFF